MLIHKDIINSILMSQGGTKALDDSTLIAFSEKIEFYISELLIRCSPHSFSTRSSPADQDISEELLMRDLELPSSGDHPRPTITLACVLEVLRSSTYI